MAPVPPRETDGGLKGTPFDDSLSGGSDADTLTGFAGDDTLFGADGGDAIFGGRDYDEIDGGKGDDLIRGAGHADTLDGGAGNDTVLGAFGTDVFHYDAAENAGASDLYVGAQGFDTLYLHLTREAWLDPVFQSELDTFLQATDTAGYAGVDHVFSSLGLELINLDAIRITIDGTEVLLDDAPVVATDDAVAFFKAHGSADGNVLENDEAPNYAASLVLGALPVYGAVVLGDDGTFTYTLDPTDPAVIALSEGEVLTDIFTYTVTDTDGDSDTATVTVTISGFPPSDEPLGFAVYGQFEQGFLGQAVAGGDVNGDGLADLVIGGDLDRATVIFGVAGGHTGIFDLTTLDGSNGFVADNGASSRPGSSLFGYTLDVIGDFNGDGIDDIVISDKVEWDGRVYVVYGSDASYPASFDVRDMTAAEGFMIYSSAGTVNQLGNSVRAAGDVNGDGIADLVVGTYYGDDSAFVVFGREDGVFPDQLDLNTLDGSDGFRLQGPGGSQAGGFVTGIGDINGDGIDDLLIGADEYTPPSGDWTGRAYVVFGSDAGFDAEVDLTTLGGTDGFAIETDTRYEGIGWGVTAAGDMNGDGLEDVALGTYSGRGAYVIFGSDAGFDASIDVDSLDGSNGFKILGPFESDSLDGSSISQAGDVNGDGLGDLFISGYDQASYLIFGRDGGWDATLDLADFNSDDGYLIDHSGSDQIDFISSMAVAGDVDGDGFDDFIFGAGYDMPTDLYDQGQALVAYGGPDGLASLDAADGVVDGILDLTLLADDPFGI